MQISPHTLYTMLVSYFVARTTIFNSYINLYCYNPPIVPRRWGHQDQARNKHNLPNRVPKRSPNRSRSQRTPDRSSFWPPNWTPDCLNNPLTERVPRRRNQDETNRTKPISVTFSWLNSQSLLRSPDWDHKRTPDILIDTTIAQLISRSIKTKRTSELLISRSPKQVEIP